MTAFELEDGDPGTPFWSEPKVKDQGAFCPYCYAEGVDDGHFVDTGLHSYFTCEDWLK